MNNLPTSGQLQWLHHYLEVGCECKKIKTGEVHWTDGDGAINLPNIPCVKAVLFFNDVKVISNGKSVYVGFNKNLLLPQDATIEDVGIPLAPNIPNVFAVDNLNKIFMITDTNTSIFYMVIQKPDENEEMK